MGVNNNIGLIIILAVITYVVLDVNNVNYEKSNTNKYLTRIGLAPYVNKALKTINNNKFYRDTIYPSYTKLVKTVRFYTGDIRKALTVNFYKLTDAIKVYTIKLIEFFDEIIYPKLVEFNKSATKSFQNYVVPAYRMAQEKILNFFAVLEKNEAYIKFQEYLVKFLHSTQKYVVNGVEWVFKNVQQIIS